MIQFNSICVFSTSHTQTLSVSRARHFYRFLFFFCEKKLHHNITFLFCSVCVLVSFSVSLVCPTKIERLCASVFFPYFFSFLDWSILFIFFHFVSTVWVVVSVWSCFRWILLWQLHTVWFYFFASIHLSSLLHTVAQIRTNITWVCAKKNYQHALPLSLCFCLFCTFESQNTHAHMSNLVIFLAWTFI